MVQFSSQYRSTEAEIMDDFQFQGDVMKKLLTDLKFVNKWLGGNKITFDGIIKLLKDHENKDTITILDIGCGDGEMLRECASLGKSLGLQFKLIGLDANDHIIKEAKIRSAAFPNIFFYKKDVLQMDDNTFEFDIALCTLFLHHLPNENIVNLLQTLTSKAKLGVVINDLERSNIAFVLFKAFGAVFLKTKIARHDGLVSIARGFTRKDLLLLSEKIKNSTSKIKWKWAFRYQWILE